MELTDAFTAMLYLGLVLLALAAALAGLALFARMNDDPVLPDADRGTHRVGDIRTWRKDAGLD